MAKHRVLYICHDHPSLSIGGTEVFTYELFRAMRESESFEPILLARTASSGHQQRKGTPFFSVSEDPNEILWSPAKYDGFWMTSPHKEQYTTHLREFLLAYRPDVVHIQQTAGLGLDVIRQIRESLPGAPIIFTSHEFQPICHARGHMLRTRDDELCDHASPLRCHECFPEVAPREFFLRERLIRSHLSLVDLFLAPSHFLRTRFVEWGIPADKIRFLENGRVVRPASEPASSPPTSHFGFFGQLQPDKGLLVLLHAVRLLSRRGIEDLRVFINGANLRYQEESFRKQVRALFEECADSITIRGKYNSSQLADRLAEVAWVVVPSTWWENSPMVIQEAFMHGRPVICSNIGGMAEKVDDGINGYHFRVGDSEDLAKTLERVAASRRDWKELQRGIRPVYSMDKAIEEHCAVYTSLLEASSTARQE